MSVCSNIDAKSGCGSVSRGSVTGAGRAQGAVQQAPLAVSLTLPVSPSLSLSHSP